MKKIYLPEMYRPVVVEENQRIGSLADGGYTLPVSLCEKCERLVSFGINLDWSFEKHFSEINQHCQIECYDPTTTLQRSIYWGISRFLYSPISRRKTHYSALSVPIDYLSFFKFNRRIKLNQKFVKKNSEKGSISAKEIFKNLKHDQKTVLKIDIEGG